jgi:FkbM family methyltransferase
MFLRDTKRTVRQIVRKLRYPRTIQLPGARGGTLEFRINNTVEQFRLERYGGEQDFLQRFLRELKPDDIVFDIGASVGLMTVHAADLLTEGQVFAFEPDPETCGRLFINTRLNELKNVEIVTWAVSNRSAEITLFTHGAEGFAPSLREQTDRAGAPKNAVRVWARSLDAAIQDGDLIVPTIIKIDIEGAEILCLEGARGLLSGNFGPQPRFVFVEAHPSFLPQFDATVEDVCQLLDDAGYEAEWCMKRDEQLHYCFAPRT